jgi:hypothetical protein
MVSFPFLTNSLLLHFIGYSDDFTLSRINMEVNINDQPVREMRGQKLLNAADLAGMLALDAEEKGGDIVTMGYNPVMVRCRGGDMGAQAFHVILENVIRNSIKHAAFPKGKSLRIGIFLFENADDLRSHFTPLDAMGKHMGNRVTDNTGDWVYVVVGTDADDAAKVFELDEKLCHPIIRDDTGERDPEDWGLKEIKIAAAFLAESNTDMCNSTEPDYVQIGECTWDDVGPHLAYCLRIPKFSYADILTGELQAHPSKIVRFRSESDKRPFAPLVYCKDQSAVNDFLGKEPEVTMLFRSVPSRLIAPKGCLFTHEVAKLLPCHESESLNLPAADSLDEQAFVLKLYDAWIACLLNRLNSAGCKPGISLYLGNETKSREWDELIKAYRPNWAGTVEFLLSKPDPEEYLRDIKDINLWRHLSHSDVRGKLGDVHPKYYEEMSFHSAFFSFLHSISPKENSFLAQYVLRQIAESALLRVLVIDDRVSRTLWNRRPQERDGGQIADLAAMRIRVAGKVILGKEESEETTIALIDGDRGGIDGLETVTWQNGESVFDNEEFDLLLVHQTIFDDRLAPIIARKKGYKDKEDWVKNGGREEWVLEMRKRVPYVVFHSGRGKIKERLAKNASFLEYSALQQHLLHEPSKFFLVLLALSASGQ